MTTIDAKLLVAVSGFKHAKNAANTQGYLCAKGCSSESALECMCNWLADRIVDANAAGCIEALGMVEA